MLIGDWFSVLNCFKIYDFNCFKIFFISQILSAHYNFYLEKK